jgi:hypothetical protein
MNKVVQKGINVEIIFCQYNALSFFIVYYITFHIHRLYSLIFGVTPYCKSADCTLYLDFTILPNEGIYMNKNISIGNNDGLRTEHPGLDSREGQEFFFL